MKRIALVTGAAGFIGRHVCRHLASRGYWVLGIGHGEWAAEEFPSWGVSVWRKERISLDALESLVCDKGEPEILIHCAGGSSVSLSVSEPYRDFQKTVVTMADVLEFSRRRAGRLAVVYPSSAAVYGIVDSGPIAEKACLCPVSPYGVHKRMAEALCQSYAAHWKVPVAIVRLFSVYGAGLRKQLLWDACVKADSGNFSFSGAGDEIRDWLHVSDAASLLFLAAEKASPDCPVVNGGSGIGRSVKEMLSQLGGLMSPPIMPLFSGERRIGDPPTLVADVSSMHAWGHRPNADLQISLAEYVRWYSSEHPS